MRGTDSLGAPVYKADEWEISFSRHPFKPKELKNKHCSIKYYDLSVQSLRVTAY